MNPFTIPKFATWIFTAFCLLPQGAVAQSDRGIGGTGAPISRGKSVGQDSGTGIYGTIAGFGSIIVNGRRVELPLRTPVAIDGSNAGVGALEVGQVVRVTTSGSGARLQASRIEVIREVVGTVEAVSFFGKDFEVLGQRILVPAGVRAPVVGQRVAVDGLRMPDGVIAASRISAASGSEDQLVGTLQRSPAGEVLIGNVALLGLDAKIRKGTRVVVRGAKSGEKFQVSRSRTEPPLVAMRGIRAVSIESFASLSNGYLKLGSGLSIRVNASTDMNTVPRTGGSRVVIDATLGLNGEFWATRVDAFSNGGEGGGNSSSSPGRAPGAPAQGSGNPGRSGGQAPGGQAPGGQAPGGQAPGNNAPGNNAPGGNGPGSGQGGNGPGGGAPGGGPGLGPP